MKSSIDTCPDYIDGAEVICFSAIDKRHCINPDMEREQNQNLAQVAICKFQNDSLYYIFNCDKEWNVLFDTSHETMFDALKFSETSYRGVFKTWTRK